MNESQNTNQNVDNSEQNSMAREDVVKDVAKENKQSAKSAKNTEKAESEFEFVTETIKKKPINTRRVFRRVVMSICLGLLMGVVACLVFVLLVPKLQALIYPDKPKEITIIEDEISQAEMQADNEIDAENSMLSEDENLSLNIDNKSENSDDNEDTSSENGTGEEGKETSDDSSEEITENKDEDSLSEENSEQEEQEAEQTPTTIINQIIEEKSFTIDDYKAIYRQMSNIGNEASKAITSVRGVTEGTDWFMNSYETGNETTGLILADNGKELLIITNNLKLVDAKEIEVTFCNGETYTGIVKKSDSETGLVAVAVNLEDLSNSVNNSIAMARLGVSSTPSLVGTPVIALGAPLGISGSMATGVVTSNKRELDVTDSSLRYITTDIYGSTSGSGVIIDLEGRVLGIIFQGGTGSDTKNLIHAYSISDIKSKLEKLSNGQEIAYLGIKGTDVTKEANETLMVPMGAYITQVTVDSPAMRAGIQNGDVIVKLGTTDISSFSDYKEAMLKCQPGDLMMVTIKRKGKDDYVEISFEIELKAQP